MTHNNLLRGILLGNIPSAGSNGTIKLGGFNLQVFGTAKADKPEVMEVLSKIIRNYDIIALEEIRDSTQTALPRLLDAINSVGGPRYPGLNEKRRNYKKLLKMVMDKQVSKIVITYPDRLIRFGFDTLMDYFSYFGVDIERSHKQKEVIENVKNIFT
ncbi:MAG: hypothetical protein FIB08_14370 [Candidatus Methanoperedens sp.]|nr:hypothetical protein [Candidatus Methanoperedens sp.]